MRLTLHRLAPRARRSTLLFSLWLEARYRARGFWLTVGWERSAIQSGSSACGDVTLDRTQGEHAGPLLRFDALEHQRKGREGGASGLPCVSGRGLPPNELFTVPLRRTDGHHWRFARGVFYHVGVPLKHLFNQAELAQSDVLCVAIKGVWVSGWRHVELGVVSRHPM